MPENGSRPSLGDVLVQRMINRSEPGARTDGEYVVLAAAGGGEGQAQFLTGLLRRLKQRGRELGGKDYDGLNALDQLDLSSSAVIVFAYGAADAGDGAQMDLGDDIFKTHLRDPRYYSRRRLISGAVIPNSPPGMDNHFLVYGIMMDPTKSPLDLDRLAGHGLTINAYTTSESEGGKAVAWDLTDPTLTHEQRRQIIKAATRFPFWGGHPVLLWNGDANADSGLGTHGAASQQVIQQRAQMPEGAPGRPTRLLVVNREPIGTRYREPDPVHQLGHRLWRRSFPNLAEAVRSWVRGFNANQAFLDHVATPGYQPEEGELDVTVIAPPRGAKIPRASVNGLGKGIRQLGEQSLDHKLRRSLQPVMVTV